MKVVAINLDPSDFFLVNDFTLPVFEKFEVFPDGLFNTIYWVSIKWPLLPPYKVVLPTSRELD